MRLAGSERLVLEFASNKVRTHVEDMNAARTTRKSLRVLCLYWSHSLEMRIGSVLRMKTGVWQVPETAHIRPQG